MYKASNIRKLCLYGPCFRALCFMCCGVSNVAAQDIHFSQNFSSPFHLNPSLTGDFHGDYRVVANYRNQWNSITIPYRTFALAGDVREFMGYEPAAVGLAVFHDMAGDAALSTTAFQVSGAFEYHVTSDKNQIVAFGLQPGLIRQDFDASKLHFDNQYNEQTGLFDPMLPANENYRTSQNMWFTFNAGMRWSYHMDERHRADAGVSAYHLAGPASDERYLNSTSQRDRLQKRWNFHANYQRKVHAKVDLIPGVIYSTQGKSQRLVAGMSSRYLYNGTTTLHLGYWYRRGDAGFATFGITYRTLYMAVSYDINTSRLREVSNGRGAIEFSLIYVFHKFRPNDGKYISCPNYL